MKPWPKVSLGEVLSLDLDRVPVDAVTSYPMVGVLSFGRGLFDKEPVENGKTSYKYFYRLKADHVVMSQLFGWEGALALSSKKFAGKFVSPQFPTFTCNSDRLDRYFLGWAMRRSTFWDELGSRASGMGDRRRTLNPDALFACEIPLPPLQEQQGIVARIAELSSLIDEARSLRRQAIEEVEIFLRSILMQDAEAKPTAMRELVRLRTPDVTVMANETYQFAGVYSFGRGIFKAQKKTGMDFVYPKLMAWEGAFGIVPASCDGCVVSTEFPVFEVNEDRVFPEILDSYFKSPAVWPEISDASTGTNVRRRRLNPQDFLSYRIPLPSRQTQLRFRNAYTEAETLRQLQSKTVFEMDALLPATLDRAFRDEL